LDVEVVGSAPGQHDEGQQVSDESSRSDDGHHDPVDPEPVVVVVEPLPAVRRGRIDVVLVEEGANIRITIFFTTFWRTVGVF
jgi:hypothetical protein